MRWRFCVNGSRAESGCTLQHGLGGEIEEFVDETHFAYDPGFEQDAHRLVMVRLGG